VVGANVNLSNNQGQTALHVGAKNGEAGAVEILLENGCDTNKQVWK
jgi:ankyrin repeat protein